MQQLENASASAEHEYERHKTVHPRRRAVGGGQEQNLGPNQTDRSHLFRFGLRYRASQQQRQPVAEQLRVRVLQLVSPPHVPYNLIRARAPQALSSVMRAPGRLLLVIVPLRPSYVHAQGPRPELTSGVANAFSLQLARTREYLA